MPGPQVKFIARMLRSALGGGAGLDAAVEQVRGDLAEVWSSFDADLSAELAEAREIVEREFGQIEILRGNSVIRRRDPWYIGPSSTDTHWPRLKVHLEETKDWSPETIQGLHHASNEVVSLLEDPRQPEYSCRGLVVGHVQSGKTASMTAVIAKALDAGYNTVIVLAGLTNKLRFQTQSRLVEDLVPSPGFGWEIRTPTDVNEDFAVPPHGGLLLQSGVVQLAVVKKNVSPLDRLCVAIRATLPVARKKLRVLVIDDECDQASVNAPNREMDITAINQRIRCLLAMLPAVSYVGYTATPFANVLINPYPAGGDLPDDLYPRDFITALPTPKHYFGAERLFGRPPVDAGNVRPEEEGLDMIRIVPEDEQKLLQPPSREDREQFDPTMTSSLETAILYFLACCAARRSRGAADKHMTMLVHTSPYVVMHTRLAELITAWKNRNRDGLLRPESEVSRRLGAVWHREKCRLPSDITEAPAVRIDDIREHLAGVLERLEVPIENGSSADRIDYGEVPRTYIVVGGSILARGLTLEGLMVSYFLRSSRQYDTLLQMGRWFGYRPQYEDLPRIWMTEEQMLLFRGLAGIEQEVRDEIEQYRILEQTPMDIAVRIRVIPGMAITAAAKMRSAHQCAVSFWGTHRQTFRFEHRNAQVLEQNWNTTSDLVDQADTLGCRDRDWPSRLWRRVPKSLIKEFFEGYSAHATHRDLASAFLVSFLETADPRLDHWNLGIVEPETERQSARPLGAAGTIRLVTRSRLKGNGTTADIKALMSRADVRFDCPPENTPSRSWEELKTARRSAVGEVPLLLIYAIDKGSSPRSNSSAREPLDAVDHVLGYGIVFPGTVAEGGNHVSVPLEQLSAEELAEIEAEDAAQVEAASAV